MKFLILLIGILIGIVISALARMDLESRRPYDDSDF